MNKLIIVGNGFDLYNGLPSRYSDFLKWHVKKCLKAALLNQTYCNLLKINKVISYDSVLSAKVNDLNHLLEIFLDMNNKYLDNKGSAIQFQGEIFCLKVEKPSPFMKSIIKHYTEKKWVDIELTYYYFLKNILHQSEFNKEDKLIKLNEEFEELKLSFIIYLNEILPLAVVQPHFDYCADSPIDIDYIKDKSHIKRLSKEDFYSDLNIRAKSICFLNFNYTNLTYKLRRANYQHINIHGTLNGDINNRPIFGFGDEIDSDYYEMEKTNNNNYFTHIKSFEYFKNSNYSQLVDFINSDSYIVYIWGHSCGLSDRTLLNMVFEHDNCAAIKPYYWDKGNGINNYTEITQNISRHFKNKLKLRNRVVSFDRCSPLGSQI